MARAAIGLGSNLGNPAENIRSALQALGRAGTLVAQSRLYRSKPWGVAEQPEFCNAVALLETKLEPRELLAALKDLERELGREPSARWGPRVIDLDILTFGDRRVDEADLQIPHPRLFERAFALVPLAELDPAFAPAVEGLRREERETVALMSDDQQQASGSSAALVDRVRALAQAFLETDLVRLRIEEPNEDAVEIRRRANVSQPSSEHAEAGQAGVPPAPIHLDAVKADLVGIFHLSRPQVSAGDVLESDRELAYVEALGIRNPVRSLGPGRIAAVHCRDGQAVEYGQVLFEIDRG